MLLLRGHTGPVRALAYSPDGGVLASGGDDCTIRLWDRAGGESLTAFAGHKDAVRGLAFHPAGKILYSGSWDGTIQRWVAEYPPGAALLSRVGCIWSLALSPDGHEMVFGADNNAQVWRIAEESPRYELEGHTWPVTGVAFAHGSKHVLTVGQDRTIRLWDGHWGSLIHATPQYPDWFHGVAISADSRTIASAGGDGLIRLMTLPDLATTTTLRGHRGDVFAVAFLAEERALLSAGADGTLRLWDTSTGRERRVLDLGLGRLFRLAVAPDGMTAAVAGESNDILMIDLDMGDHR